MGDSAQSGYTFGNQVRLRFHVLREVIEQLVQLDELELPFHVPVSELCLGFQVTNVGQPGI